MQPQLRKGGHVKSMRFGCVVGLLWWAATPAFAQAPQGFRTTPTLGWTHGDHRVDLGLSTRARGEYWKA